MQTEPTTAVVVLAAGEGRRLGGVAKALLPVGQGTLLDRALATAALVGIAPAQVVVVVGAPHGDAVAAAARAAGCVVVVNPAPARGMASSIAVGFAALGSAPATITGALLWPIDHGLVGPATLHVLLPATSHDAVAPRYADRGGHPVWIARRAWPALAACGDVVGGARAVMRGWDRAWIDVDDAAVVLDLDEPADLARLA